MSDMSQPQLSRRRVFAAGGTVGALAAAAVVIPAVRQAEPAPAEGKPAPDKGGGYQVTQHVLHYYQTARI